MKTLLAFALLAVISVARVDAVFPFEIPLKLGQCMLDNCGPPKGYFTWLCNQICKTSRFAAGGTCLHQRDAVGERASCTCSGDIGDARMLLQANCEFFCPLGCFTCGFTGGNCTGATTTQIGCTCTKWFIGRRVDYSSRFLMDGRGHEIAEFFLSLNNFENKYSVVNYLTI